MDTKKGLLCTILLLMPRIVLSDEETLSDTLTHEKELNIISSLVNCQRRIKMWITVLFP